MEGQGISGPEDGSVVGELEIRDRVLLWLRPPMGNAGTRMSYLHHTASLLGVSSRRVLWRIRTKECPQNHTTKQISQEIYWGRARMKEREGGRKREGKNR